MADATGGRLLWQPSHEHLENAGLTHYLRWLQEHDGLSFADYGALWQWSVDHLEDFWESIWRYYDVTASAAYTRVLAERTMPGARWFEGAKLNYAEHALRHATGARPAICFQSEIRPYTEISWAELELQVAGVANALKGMGVRAGDRVVAYLPNLPQTAVALLATASLGAIWSSTSPDLGHVSVIDRFEQIAPKVLFAVDGYQYGGKRIDRRTILGEILSHLPSVEHVVFVPYLDPAATPDGIANARLWDDVVTTPGPLDFAQVAFDHPLWVVYSSGTTGMPKPIVHGHGGIVLETLKHGDLQMDVKREDRFFWYSSTNWIMWNLLVNNLIGGTTILMYDGSPTWPDGGALWRFADRAGATFFGASAAYIAQCMKADVHPREQMSPSGIARLRTVGSTGSPLPVDGYEWVYRELRPDVLLACISGGTDPCAVFVGCCPILPLYAGEMQARALGCAIYSYDAAGEPLTDEVGELVCAQPLPSFPLYFWNDHDGRRYHESYFETYPDRKVWRHGDWIRITPRGGAIIYGRSDSTINRRGIRLGSAEIYRVVEAVEEVADSLVVDLEYLGRESYMPLFVVLRAGSTLDDALTERIKQRIRTNLSGHHVPNDVFAVPDVPRTLNGKKLEVPIKRLLLGEPLEKVVNRDSMQNPASLAWFVEFAARTA